MCSSAGISRPCRLASNRAQAALTQFDETGVIVRVRDDCGLPGMHTPALFDPVNWQSDDIAITAVFGHALMERHCCQGDC